MVTATSVYEYARRGLALSSEKTAVWFCGTEITYRSLFERIDNVADHLSLLGVSENTVVTIHLPNCPQAAMAVYAVAKLGGICDMVHAQTPPQALKKNMEFTESKVLITYLPECAGAAEQTVLADVSYHMAKASCAGVAAGGYPEGTHRFEDYEEACARKARYPDQRGLAEKCAFYLHSSGSTGRPKTICLSHSALNNCVEDTADLFENRDMHTYVSLGVLPMFHGFGLAMDLHRNISWGSKLVMMPRWDSRLAVQLIREHRVSLMVGVPTMYYALLNEPDFCGEGISQLSKCYVGGDNVKPELVREFDARIDGKHHMFVGYGLTEATTTDCVNSYRHYKAGSSGFPTRSVTVAVMDEAGTISRSGTGELVVSGKTLMLGYLKDPAATEETLFSREGKLWTHTGDYAEIDEEGFVHFKDRMKNIIIHNGYNIYPAQVEDAVRSADGVKDVCVVGVTDEALHTQNVRAVVILKQEAGQQQAKEKILEQCSRLLPRYSVPKEIVFVEAFPQNAMGKIDRIALGRAR